jgi:hypothetical protein
MKHSGLRMSKPHEPNDILIAKVKCWAEWLPEKTIAKRIKVSVPTLRKYYGEILGDAPLERDMEVVKALYKNATINGNVTAQIFWVKYRMGIKDDGSSAGGDNYGQEAQPLNISFDVQQPVGDITITEGEKKPEDDEVA